MSAVAVLRTRLALLMPFEDVDCIALLEPPGSPTATGPETLKDEQIQPIRNNMHRQLATNIGRHAG